MRTTARGVMSILVLTAVAAAATSCSTDTLDSGTQALAVKYVPSPSGSGRYERAAFNISTVRVLPADPELAALYGNNPLSLRFDPFIADLTSTQAVTFAQIALSTGTYNVIRIDFTSPILTDTNVSPTPATCIEGVAALPSGPAASQVPAITTFDSSAGLAFTVSPGQSKLSLTVNVPGLISGYEAAFTCNPDCGAGQPCLTTFNQANYRSALLANISFQ